MFSLKLIWYWIKSLFRKHTTNIVNQPSNPEDTISVPTPPLKTHSRKDLFVLSNELKSNTTSTDLITAPAEQELIKPGIEQDAPMFTRANDLIMEYQGEAPPIMSSNFRDDDVSVEHSMMMAKYQKDDDNWPAYEDEIENNIEIRETINRLKEQMLDKRQKARVAYYEQYLKPKEETNKPE